MTAQDISLSKRGYFNILLKLNALPFPVNICQYHKNTYTKDNLFIAEGILKPLVVIVLQWYVERVEKRVLGLFMFDERSLLKCFERSLDVKLWLCYLCLLT